MKLRSPFWVVLILAVAAGGYATRAQWLPLLHTTTPADSSTSDSDSETEEVAKTSIIVNEIAQENLGLKAKPLKAMTYWKTIQVPGMVIDLPGQSDRGIVTPATGVVTNVYHFPSESVKTGEVLFTVKLLSESLLLTQSDLFKTTQNIAIAQAQKERLTSAGSALPEARRIEVENEITRLHIASQAYRQELQNRGLHAEAIDRIASGDFVNEIQIHVPPPLNQNPDQASVEYEVQTLDVTLGQQVQAGQTLCTLANHQRLAVEGYAFRDETPLLERSVLQSWPVSIDFLEQRGDWEQITQSFHVSHVANTIDPVKRTFAFRIPLCNESRTVAKVSSDTAAGHTQTLWRFRPGQKVKIQVRVEELKNVFVLPSDALAMDGPEAFVFLQNVNTFTRLPVHVVMRDHENVVIANDGALLPGSYAVQSAAEQLNRMIKSGGNSGVPKGYHIHADGSLHKNEDEGK